MFLPGPAAPRSTPSLPLSFKLGESLAVHWGSFGLRFPPFLSFWRWPLLYSVCANVCVPHVCREGGGQKMASAPLKPWLQMVERRASCSCWELNLGSLEHQPVLSSMKPAFQLEVSPFLSGGWTGSRLVFVYEAPLALILSPVRNSSRHRLLWPGQSSHSESLLEVNWRSL